MANPFDALNPGLFSQPTGVPVNMVPANAPSFEQWAPGYQEQLKGLYLDNTWGGGAGRGQKDVNYLAAQSPQAMQDQYAAVMAQMAMGAPAAASGGGDGAGTTPDAGTGVGWHGDQANPPGITDEQQAGFYPQQLEALAQQGAQGYGDTYENVLGKLMSVYDLPMPEGNVFPQPAAYGGPAPAPVPAGTQALGGGLSALAGGGGQQQTIAAPWLDQNALFAQGLGGGNVLDRSMFGGQY